jgi:hypothetical protein
MGTAGPAELEAALRGLGAELAYPAGEALSGIVRTRLEAAPGRRRWWHARPGRAPRLRLSVVLAIVGLALLAAVAGAALLGLPGLRIVFAPPGTTPAVSMTAGTSPTASPARSPAEPGEDLGLGRVIEGDPGQAVRFDVRVPSDPALGPPDRTFLQSTPAGPVVYLVWGAREGLPATTTDGAALLVAQFEGRVGAEFFEKMVDRGTIIEDVTVGDGRGYWISGPPHEIYVVGEDGEVYQERRRIVGDTLIWRRDGLTFRLEGAPDRPTALRIAESIR